jgi:hypothetical protein
MARGNLSSGPVVRESVRHPYVAGNANNRSEDGDSQGVAPRPRRQMPAANRTGTMDANKSALRDGFVDFHRIKRTFVDVTIVDAGHGGARVVCPRSWPILTELGATRPFRDCRIQFSSLHPVDWRRDRRARRGPPTETPTGATSPCAGRRFSRWARVAGRIFSGPMR